MPYITNILNTLASDEMRRRSALTKDIEKAADYIAEGISKVRSGAIRGKELTAKTFQVDPLLKILFKPLFEKIYGKESLVAEGNTVFTNSFVFILGHQISDDYQVELKNNYETIPMFNVAGIIPGKSKARQDSIANGADDDASGVTAMIALAKHFKKVNKNERTLIFVAFTGEELGMYVSTYFSKHINPDQVTAMINMEMIGKDSKSAPITMYITGYDQSIGRN
ncbi:hypothetical protein FQR65_LT18028 [Abscondita terminalis]|nr:hypothetical protein FQR65_LT18028 [Abscondita terminalis]